MLLSKLSEKIKKLERFPTYFCKAKRLRQKLAKIAKSKKPKKILNKYVWVVPNFLVGEKIAIRPFGIIFVSKKIPKNLLDIVVKHEIAEEKWKSLSKKAAHKKAIQEELKYAKKRKKLKKLLKFLKKNYPALYLERIRELHRS